MLCNDFMQFLQQKLHVIPSAETYYIQSEAYCDIFAKQPNLNNNNNQKLVYVLFSNQHQGLR